MGENFQTTSSLKVHRRLIPTFFSLTWDHMWVTVSNDISEGTCEIHSLKSMYTPREGLYYYQRMHT